jgi:hypothetical protein
VHIIIRVAYDWTGKLFLNIGEVIKEELTEADMFRHKAAMVRVFFK